MKKRIVTLLAALLAVTAVVSGCGGSTTGGSEDDLTHVSMAFCTFTGYAPMFIAKEQGYFEEAGIDMEFQIIEDESTYASLITKGDIQFLATAQDPNIKMYANGATSKYVLTMDQSVGADGL
jgi:NitT/TauT family transport system substrate-binding protein